MSDHITSLTVVNYDYKPSFGSFHPKIEVHERTSMSLSLDFTLSQEIPVLTREVPFEHVPELVRNAGSSGGGGSGKFHRHFLRKEYESHAHVKGEKALLGKTHHQQLFIDEEEERAIKKRMKKAKKRRQMPTLYKENLHEKIADSESSSND